MTAPRRHRGRPVPSKTVDLEIRVTPALRASLEARAEAGGLTLSDVCRALLEGDQGTEALYLATWRSGYRAGVREASARIDTLGREVPWPEVER